MIELLWPTRCAGCDRAGAGWLCEICSPRHLLPVEAAVECVSAVRALDVYGSPIGRALRRAKFTPDRRLLCHLGQLLGELAAAEVAAGADVVVAVPSSWPTRLRRGFATGAVLAAAVGRCSGVPVRHPLRLARGTRQSTQGRRDRYINLTGRVRCTFPVRGRVSLIDDVVTTGSTASACARELLGAGADRVTVVALCTALRSDRKTPVQNP